MLEGRPIDLNSDVGEAYGAWPGGPDDLLMPLLTSVNVACGYHAGDPSTIRHTCRASVDHGCVIGAQVSYPDLMGFGRRFLDMQPAELTDSVLYQLGALDAFAKVERARVLYVKPHGALYNAIVHHEAQAQAVVEAVALFDANLSVLGLPRSAVEDACHQAGLRFVAEGFADRRYRPDGTLVPRTDPRALITDPDAAGRQALELAAWGVESICVHSDTPGAVDIVRTVARMLVSDGYRLEAFALR